MDPTGHSPDDYDWWEDVQIIFQGVGAAMGAIIGARITPLNPEQGATAGGVIGAVIMNHYYHWFKDWADDGAPVIRYVPGHEHFLVPIQKGLEGVPGTLKDLWNRFWDRF